MELVAAALTMPALKVLRATLQECVDIATRIMSYKAKVKEDVSAHLLALAKMHVTFTLATIKAGKFAIEKFIYELNNCEINEQISRCIDDIYHNLLMIESRLDACKTIGITCCDTLLIYECVIDLLNNHFQLLKQIASNHCLSPITSVNRVYQDFQRLRPVVYDKAIISLKSDRNENFLGTPGPNPVYKIGGITELTTQKFGDYAKIKIEKFIQSSHEKNLEQQDSNIVKYCDKICLSVSNWGNLRHYITGHFQQSWWEYKCEINERAIFKLVHPIASDITRELRFGDRVCLEIIVGSNNNWKHRFVSGKLNSRVLKLSSTRGLFITLMEI